MKIQWSKDSQRETFAEVFLCGNTIVNLMVVIVGVNIKIWSYKLQWEVWTVEFLILGKMNKWNMKIEIFKYPNLKTKCSCQILAMHEFVWKMLYASKTTNGENPMFNVSRLGFV